MRTSLPRGGRRPAGVTRRDFETQYHDLGGGRRAGLSLGCRGSLRPLFRVSSPASGPPPA
jgi:hypothetical protein